MHVKLSAPGKRKMSPISTKTYPAGWAGEVPDDVGQTWIDAGIAGRTDAEPAPVVTNTPPPAEDKPKARSSRKSR